MSGPFSRRDHAQDLEVYSNDINRNLRDAIVEVQLALAEIRNGEVEGTRHVVEHLEKTASALGDGLWVARYLASVIEKEIQATHTPEELRASREETRQ